MISSRPTIFMYLCCILANQMAWSGQTVDPETRSEITRKASKSLMEEGGFRGGLLVIQIALYFTLIF
jgi:hypothetical protein